MYVSCRACVVSLSHLNLHFSWVCSSLHRILTESSRRRIAPSAPGVVPPPSWAAAIARRQARWSWRMAGLCWLRIVEVCNAVGRGAMLSSCGGPESAWSAVGARSQRGGHDALGSLARLSHLMRPPSFQKFKVWKSLSNETVISSTHLGLSREITNLANSYYALSNAWC